MKTETYFEAWKRRREKINEELYNVAHDLKKISCDVYVNKDPLIVLVKAIKGDEHCVFGFSEVPYRWYIQICITPSHERGSSYTKEESYIGLEPIEEMSFPWGALYLISRMEKNPPEWKKHLKRETNYLKKL